MKPTLNNAPEALKDVKGYLPEDGAINVDVALAAIMDTAILLAERHIDEGNEAEAMAMAQLVEQAATLGCSAEYDAPTVRPQIAEFVEANLPLVASSGASAVGQVLQKADYWAHTDYRAAIRALISAVAILSAQNRHLSQQVDTLTGSIQQRLSVLEKQ